MAKRFDNDFDAEGFVDQFRASDGSVSSRILGKNKERTNNNEQNDEQPTIESVNTVKKGQSGSAFPSDYKTTFIENLKYRFPAGVWSSVKIHPDFTALIHNLIIASRSHRTTLSSFINNVLEEHFRLHDEEIKKIIKD